MKMTKGKSFWLGVAFVISLQFALVYVWNNHFRYMPYDVWEYYPDAKSLEAQLLEDHPLGSPVAHLMKKLDRTKLTFQGDLAGSAHFSFGDDKSCCALYYQTARDKYLRNKYQSIRVDLEFDSAHNITSVKVHMGESKLQWAP